MAITTSFTYRGCENEPVYVAIAYAIKEAQLAYLRGEPGICRLEFNGVVMSIKPDDSLDYWLDEYDSQMDSRTRTLSTPPRFVTAV